MNEEEKRVSKNEHHVCKESEPGSAVESKDIITSLPPSCLLSQQNQSSVGLSSTELSQGADSLSSLYPIFRPPSPFQTGITEDPHSDCYDARLENSFALNHSISPVACNGQDNSFPSLAHQDDTSTLSSSSSSGSRLSFFSVFSNNGMESCFPVEAANLLSPVVEESNETHTFSPFSSVTNTIGISADHAVALSRGVSSQEEDYDMLAGMEGFGNNTESVPPSFSFEEWEPAIGNTSVDMEEGVAPTVRVTRLFHIFANG